MSGEPDGPLLRHLRRMDEKLDRIGQDVRDLKLGMTGMQKVLAGVSRRLDRLETRLDRVAQRLIGEAARAACR
jgi:archaellum component FlaC